MKLSYLTPKERLLYSLVQKTGCISESQVYRLFGLEPEQIKSTAHSLGLLIRQQFLYSKNRYLLANLKQEHDQDMIDALWVYLDTVNEFTEDSVGSVYATDYPSSLTFFTQNSMVEVAVIDEIRKLVILNEKYKSSCCDEELDKEDGIKFRYILIFKDESLIKRIPKELDFIKDKAYICCILDSNNCDNLDYRNPDITTEDIETAGPKISYIW